MDHNLADEHIYMQRCSLGTAVIVMYVDDLLIACNNDSLISSAKEQLIKAFQMKDLGETRVIL